MNYSCLSFSMAISVSLHLVLSFAHALPPGLSNFPLFTTGNFSNILYDDGGNPLWNISGEWIGNLPSIDKVNSKYVDAVFNANISIITTNSTQHNYSLNDFFLTNFSSISDMKIFNGTAVINADMDSLTVPVDITFTDEKIKSLELEPDVIVPTMK